MKKLLINFLLFSALTGVGYLLFNAFKFEDNGKTFIKNTGIPDHRTCATEEVYERLSKGYPDYKKNREQLENLTREYIKNHKNKDNVLITIPVVVHVVYNTPQQNISEDQVLSQISVLNRDYRRHNTDTVNTPVPFKPIGADVQVEFCMARRDPNNNPTTGITRTQTNVQSFTTDNAVKYTASGGIDGWDRNRYLNIWVCNLGNNLLGYAEYPGGPASSDGVVILCTAFGTGGSTQPPYNLGRTATHEVGHWLNLIHIWGDDNGACTGSDQCNDTPNQGAENYGCPGFPHTDNCSPNSPGVMYMNYMDYTDDGCMNIFTMDQSARMISAINTFRSPILTANSCQNVSGHPIADFFADSTSILFGGIVHFSDNSAGIPTSWSWSFPGGNPSSSILQNPAVTYTTIGVYPVTQRIFNTFGGDSLTKTGYITVRGMNMNVFSLVLPPSLTRITTSASDMSIENFIWTKSAPSFVNYKWKLKKIGGSIEYSYPSNSSGTDTVAGFRKSFLDSLASVMGTTGDSVRCTWKAVVYNGLDSLSTNGFLVTFVRSPIGIQKISTNVPDKFVLYNNFPNPFNPSTIFKFDVAKTQNIKLTIYDMLGREVAVLHNGMLQPGTYSISWNASSFASGIYYYKMTVGDNTGNGFTDVKKMVLVK